ncbi:MAG: T9SS type A sorting domain-containing protein [Ignavibacteria bacterium]|nr:T9SS type A sorting domain-containing protein [Ignavibacteria bacterium]
MKTITIFFIVLLATLNLSFAGWSVVNMGTNYNFTDIQLKEGPNFFATAYNPTTYAGVLFKSINNGANWTQIQLPSICQYPTSCDFSSDGLNGIVAGTSLIGTSNGGANWMTMYAASDTIILFGLDEGGGSMWAVGNKVNGNNIIGTVILRCSNIMAQIPAFTRMSLPQSMSTYQLTSVCAVDSMTCYIGVSDYPTFTGVLKTTNKGATWTQIGMNREIWAVCVSRDNGLGFAVGGNNSNCEVYKTSDYGLSWLPVFSQSSGTLKGLFRGAMVYAVGNGGIILKGNYFGDMWDWQYSGVTTDLNAVDALDQNTDVAYAVGDNGVMLKTSDGGIGVNVISTEIPSSYSLHQNYPNPFNPSTFIKFDVPIDSRLRGNDNVVLKIYDALGREVAVLVNEDLKPGTYEADWNATQYPSGVYFYRLVVGDNTNNGGNGFTETKRMVLVK